MSDAPADKTTDDKKPKPIFNPDDVVEPDAKPVVVEDPTPADIAVDVKESAPAKADKKPAAKKADASTTATAAKTDTAVVPGAATGEVAPATAESEFAGREVVYVQAPLPPRLRGNRGVGALLAVLGAALFAVVFAGVVTLSFALEDTKTMGDQFADFLQNALFWVPVLVFLVAFVLLVLIVNRAGWAAHVFGSLLVALAVYFGSIGIMLLLGVAVGAGPEENLGSLAALATNPKIIIAALVAREVSIWIGLAISARGRRVKVRNHEIVDEWEREQADSRAQYERAAATS